MPVVNLTDVTIRNLKGVPGKQVTYLDRSLKGFGVRVSPAGAMSYVLTTGRERRRIKLADVGIVPLKDARQKAKTILAEKQLGIAKPVSPSFIEARDLFLAICTQKNKPRTVRDYKRLLIRHFNFSGRVNEITPGDVNARIDKLHATPSEQNHAAVAVKVFFRWCVRRGYADHSPCNGVTQTKRAPRNRVLTDKEIAAIYKHARKRDDTMARIILLCIHTGLRRTEVAWLRKSYFTKESVTLPALLMKNRQECTLPLGPMTTALIERISGETDLLFPAERGDKVFGGWGKQKALFDKGLSIAPWVLHDLRRYFATTHAALGTPIHLTERLLHHISGSTTGGLIAIYQRHDFFEEMHAAILIYEKHLKSLIE